MTSPTPLFRRRAGWRATLLAAALAVGFSACGGADSRRYSRKEAQTTLTRLEEPGLVMGEFSLNHKSVIDGDTIRVTGLDSSLRLLAIDTEETFKQEEDRRAFESDWETYLSDKRAETSRPIKAATPMGEEAKRFGKAFFSGVKTVRLERDHPKEIRGRYNRYLTYVFAQKGGVWVNYNVEAVRAGMSPYFSKYGYSRRFHSEFVAAEAEAKAAKRGIWDPASQAYPDYDIRRKWWDARAEFVKQFEAEAETREEFIALTNWDALRRIEQHKGKEVEILATVGDIVIGDRGPTRVMLSRRMFADFPLIFFDKDVFGSSEIAKYKGEYVRVRGVVQTYKNKHRANEELQIVIKTPGQVVGSQLPNFNESATPTSLNTP